MLCTPRQAAARTSVRCLFSACAAFAGSDAVAQSSPPDMDKKFQVVRLDTKPKIDGKLDEAVWQQAAVIEDFHQISPIEYAAASQRTEIRVFYTRDALYIGGRMYDTGKVTAQTLRQAAPSLRTTISASASIPTTTSVTATCSR